jgi:HPt (histidine-containing phosphotransfer) domain-containing protein
MADAGRIMALKRLGISEEIYDELCVDFSIMAREKVVLLERAVTAADMSQATKLAHSIKGSAANLGIDNVFDIARVIEAETGKGILTEKIKDDIKRLKQCIGE